MSTPSEQTSSMRAHLERLVQQGTTMAHLDARAPGVCVPPQHAGEVHLRLNFNHEKGRRDLVVNDWGVRESLCFGGAWFPVAVPWSAIFGVSQVDNAEYHLDLEAMPDELRVKIYGVPAEPPCRTCGGERRIAVRRGAEVVDRLPCPTCADHEIGAALAALAALAIPVVPELTRGEVRRGHLRLVQPADDGAGE